MTTITKTEVKVALKTGFHESRLIEAGEEFVAPADFKAKWFASKADLKSGAVEAPAPGFLDQQVKDILAALPGKSVKEITRLIAEEQSGKARKGLLASMGDMVANRAGELDGGDAEDDNPLA
jgi:hypothetical protein